MDLLKVEGKKIIEKIIMANILTLELHFNLFFLKSSTIKS